MRASSAGKWRRGTYIAKRCVLRRAAHNESRLATLIENKLEYAFYLSDFGKGEHSKSFIPPQVAGLGGNITFAEGNHAFRDICKTIHRKIPLVYLYNAREIGGAYGGIAIVTEDENWFHRFKEIFESCTYVFLDYGNRQSNNIDRELDYIIARRPAKVIIAIDSVPDRLKNNISGALALRDYREPNSGQLISRSIDPNDPLLKALLSGKLTGTTTLSRE